MWLKLHEKKNSQLGKIVRAISKVMGGCFIDRRVGGKNRHPWATAQGVDIEEGKKDVSLSWGGTLIVDSGNEKIRAERNRA